MQTALRFLELIAQLLSFLQGHQVHGLLVLVELRDHECAGCVRVRSRLCVQALGALLQLCGWLCVPLVFDELAREAQVHYVGGDGLGHAFMGADRVAA